MNTSMWSKQNMNILNNNWLNSLLYGLGSINWLNSVQFSWSICTNV